MGRMKQVPEAKTVWVKVNNQAPQRFLLTPSSAKLDLGGENLDFSRIAINGVRAAFSSKGQTLFPFESLKKSFPEQIDGTTEAKAVKVTGPQSSVAAVPVLAVPSSIAAVPGPDSSDAAGLPPVPSSVTAVPAPVPPRSQLNPLMEKKIEPLKVYAPAVKRLIFENLSGIQTVGTAIFISSDGLFVTSLHCLLVRGIVFLGSFLVDGLTIQHVISFPALDLFVGRIKDPETKKRAYLPISVIGTVGMSYFLVHYPLVVDQEAQQPEASIPTVTQGVLSAAMNATQWIGDAESFPNSSGGAACADGQLIAIHTCSLTHEDIPASQTEEEEDFSELAFDDAWVGLDTERIREGEQPDDDSEEGASSQPLSPKTLTRKLLRVEANGQHKGTLCGMVPGSLLQLLLVKHNVLKLPKVVNLRAAVTTRKRKKV